MSNPTLPDRLIALLQAKAELENEAAALRETNHDAWVQFEMLADVQLDAVVDAMRHAHDNLFRLRMVTKTMKEAKQC